MTTGERMKERRKTLGLSAEYVAEKLGVSPATIYRYEKGDIEKMPGNILEPISRILGTTPAFLMGWDEPGLPDNIIPMPKMNTVPLIGMIACGDPILAAENIEAEVSMPEHVVSDFALRCKAHRRKRPDRRRADRRRGHAEACLLLPRFQQACPQSGKPEV